MSEWARILSIAGAALSLFLGIFVWAGYVAFKRFILEE